MASFEKFRLKDHRGELVGGGIGSGARPPIFDVRRLTSVLETPCVSQSARKRSPIMRIHTTELLLIFWSDRNSQLEIIELLRNEKTLNSESEIGRLAAKAKKSFRCWNFQNFENRKMNFMTSKSSQTTYYRLTYTINSIFDRVACSQIPICDFRIFEFFDIWEHFFFFAASLPILTQNWVSPPFVKVR